MNSMKQWFLLAVLFAGSASAFAQTNVNEEQGMGPFGSYHGGDLDSISMTGGGLSLHIPLVSFPQRGNLDLSFAVYATSKGWYTRVNQVECANPSDPNGCTPYWVPIQRGSQPQFGTPPVEGAYVTSNLDWEPDNECNSEVSGNDLLYHWAANVSSPDGGVHQLGSGTSVNGTGCPQPPYRAFDASGILQSDINNIIMPNGTRFTYNSSALTAVTDANGNRITMNSNFSAFTDTLGRVVPLLPSTLSSDVSTCPSGTASSKTWAVPGLAGGTRTFKLCYSSVRIFTNFGQGATEYTGGNNLLLTAIVLPDLTMWTFGYDHYGDITRLGLPTGGSISYAYAIGPNIGCDTPVSMIVTSRTVDANDGTGGHTWTYSYSLPTNAPGTMVVTSPEGNDTVHTIGDPVTGQAGCFMVDRQVQLYQGSRNGGTLLKTVATQYSALPNNLGVQGGGAPNVVPTQVTVTSRDGHSSKIVNTWDSTNTVAPYGTAQPVVLGSLLQRDEYDFSNTLARSTVNRYLWQDNPPYLPINFVSLKSSVTLKDGAGNQVAQTTYGYDDVSRIFAYGNTVGQGAAPAGSARGNLNYVSRWMNTTNTMITTTTNVYDTGEPYQTIDPLGHVTTFSYSPGFYGAYLTQTNLPDTQMPDSGATIVHHVISGNYDFNTGLLTSFTDENGQPYSYQYDSLMLRLTQGNHPDGGITKFFYPDPNTVERQLLISGTKYDDFKVKFDGVGRPYQTQQLTPDCTSYIKVDTVYDPVGRIQTVSNPYCLTNEPTYGVTQTTYDALSRTLNTTKQDGSVTSVKYEETPGDNVRAPLVCTTATDESGKKRQACSDAFGRLVKVMEPNPSAAATSATGSVTVNGTEQSGNSQPATSGQATITISGQEQSVTNCIGTRCFTTYDTGTVTVTVNGFSAKTVSYGRGDMPATVAWKLSCAFHNDGASAADASCPTSAGSSTQVVLTARATGTGSNYSFTTSSATTDTTGNFFSASFAAGPASGSFTGGQNASSTPDTGSITVTISGTPYAYNYGASDNAGTIAAGLANTINAGSLAHATSTADANVAVANSVFETPAVGTGNFQYNPTGGSWTFSGGTGVSANGSGFTSGNPGAPEGGQVAFIQMGANSVISQTLSGFQTGMSYTVSFSAAQRANFSNGGQDFDVYLDATWLGTFRPGSTSYSLMSTAAFTTTAGTHTLQFVGRDTAGGDNTAFIDAVQVTAPVGNSIILTSNTPGSAGDYSISTSYTWNSAQFTNPSFTTSRSGTTLGGALDAAAINNNPFVTIYQYNARGDLLCVHQKATDATADVPCTGTSAPSVPATWRQRFFTYDSFSRLLTAMNPEMNSTGSTVITYGYDNDSRMTSKTEPAPNAAWGSSSTVTLTYTYDALNRLLDTTYSDGTTLKASHRYDYATFQGQSFTNPIGREVAALTVNSSGSTVASTFASYDVMGRVANTVQCNPSVSGCKTFTASYDKVGDLTSLAYPGNGFTVTYGYDSAARLTTATDSNGVIYAQTPTYLASGAIQEFTSPNFANNKYHVSYNNRLQPIEIWAGSAQGSPALFDKQYSYGTAGANNGNIFTITNVKDSTRTQSFTYDPLNRLLTAGDNGHWANTYTYDAWGNLTNKTPGSPAGENMNQPADTNNHLSGLTYDAAGNVINDGLGGAFVFDGENRITAAGSVIYIYDADGRRIQKSSGTNYWYGPGGQVFAETDSSGTWTNYIFFGGQRLARNVNGDIKYYITDHLHSTAMFVDKAGTTAAILDDNDMHPWGGVVPGVGKTTSNNTVKFTGQYRDTDAAANLDYFGARYYSNTIGRFMSPDWAGAPTTVPYAKFGDPQSLNLYSFAGNMPGTRLESGHNYAGMNGFMADDSAGVPEGSESHGDYGVDADYDSTTFSGGWKNSSGTLVASFSNSYYARPGSDVAGSLSRDVAAYASGNFTLVGVRSLNQPWPVSHWGHTYLNIPVTVEGQVMGFKRFDVLGNTGSSENQQVRQDDPTRTQGGKWIGAVLLVATTGAQRQALMKGASYWAQPGHVCPSCGASYQRTSYNSNTWVFNMLSHNPAGSITPPTDFLKPVPGYRPDKTDADYYPH
jgi:RHS repeat-associated protein